MYLASVLILQDYRVICLDSPEEEEEFYKLRPANKTDMVTLSHSWAG